jgi:hypothetical protein
MFKTPLKVEGAGILAMPAGHVKSSECLRKSNPDTSETTTLRRFETVASRILVACSIVFAESIGIRQHRQKLFVNRRFEFFGHQHDKTPFG